MEKEILTTLKYFSFFDYPPTLEEIHTFLKKKTSKRRLASILENMEKKSLVKDWKLDDRGLKIENRSSKIENRGWREKGSFYLPSTFYLLSSAVNTPRYTLGEYSKKVKSQKLKVKSNNQQLAINNFNNRQQISLDKLKSLRFRLYIKLLAFFPQVKLVGLSGSVAMQNADEGHDVDLFIITAKNRLWTGRIIALMLAQMLGVRRKRRFWSPHFVRPQNDNNKTMKQWSNFVKNKVCLNLFFDEPNLSVPDNKKTEYVAHEVLQMKPIVQKDGIYMSFIDANRWVFDIFPNAKRIFNFQFSIFNEFSKKTNSKIKNLDFISNFKFQISNLVGGKIEYILKSFQLFFINRHRSSEIVTTSQLWFHPEDFGEKIKL